MVKLYPGARRFRLLARGLAVLGVVAGIASGLPSAAQAVTLNWEPTANMFWAVNGNAVMSIFQNGQCTQLAADKRPDVVRAIVLTTIAHEVQNGQGEAIPNFDARYWGTLAHKAGIATGKQPRVGALMVFQPGVLGAGSTGHIAYVQSVRKHRFTIAEMHAPGLYQVTFETYRRSIARRWGLRFIY
jgi:surface antigen